MADSEPGIIMRHELSEREVFFFGEILVLWGMIAHKLFMQTLATFEGVKSIEELPRAMNNIQFADIKDLWKQRVVDTADDTRKPVLLAQYNELAELNSYRDAIVHSMWSYDPADVGVLVGQRVKKKSYISFRVTVDELHEIATRLGKINVHISYPGGLEERAVDLSRSGGYMSRGFIAMVTDHPRANEFYGLPPKPPKTTP